MAGVIASDDYLYIFGGQDLAQGILSSLWRVHLPTAVSGEVEWEDITSQTARAPQYGFSHHCGVCFKDKLYFFGGSRLYTGKQGNKFDLSYRKQQNSVPENINILDLPSMTWSVGPALAEPRDDFAWAFDESAGKLYIFGGFVRGSKTNDMACFDLATQKISKLDVGTSRPASTSSTTSRASAYRVRTIKVDPSRPQPRTGARMALSHSDNCLYLFGGQNRAAETLNDLWKFSLEKETWTKLNPRGEIPNPRSGHTLTIVGGSIMMFGGLIEITKECNETFRYSLADNFWTNLKACPAPALPQHIQEPVSSMVKSPGIRRQGTYGRSQASPKSGPGTAATPYRKTNTLRGGTSFSQRSDIKAPVNRSSSALNQSLRKSSSRLQANSEYGYLVLR